MCSDHSLSMPTVIVCNRKAFRSTLSTDKKLKSCSRSSTLTDLDCPFHGNSDSDGVLIRKMKKMTTKEEDILSSKKWVQSAVGRFSLDSPFVSVPTH